MLYECFRIIYTIDTFDKFNSSDKSDMLYDFLQNSPNFNTGKVEFKTYIFADFEKSYSRKQLEALVSQAYKNKNGEYYFGGVRYYGLAELIDELALCKSILCLTVDY